MEALPPEIQLSIIENLGALDIFHLQQTCKSFYKFIEAFDHVIWRKCLQRKCTQNGLFWPSYRKHATSDEFKDACTANVRFRNATRKRRDRSTSTIPSIVTKIDFYRVVFDEVYLVPGGQFLITFDAIFLRIWSLYPDAVRDDAAKVQLISSYQMQNIFSGIAYVDVVDDTKLQMLVFGTTISNLENQEITSLLRLELTIPDDDTKFSFRKLGLIEFLHDAGEDLGTVTIPGGSDIVIFQTSCGIAMAWDSAHNRCLGWRPGSIDDLYHLELFSNHEFIFYINGSGIHGFKIPTLQPITVNRLDLSSFSDNILSPSFFIPHTRPYDIMSPADIISPCPLPLVEDQKPLVYIIKVRNDGDEDDDNYSDTFKLHWYQFRFNSDNPGSSILTLLDTTSPGSDYKNGLNPHATYYMYEDQIAIIWEDENDSEGHDSFYLSLFPIPNSLLSASSSPHAGISDSQGKKEDNFKIVPFARYPVAPDDDTVPVVLDQAFCIHTGKAIVHCWTPENDARWVDWYNFVEKRD